MSWITLRKSSPSRENLSLALKRQVNMSIVQDRLPEKLGLSGPGLPLVKRYILGLYHVGYAAHSVNNRIRVL